MENQFSKKPRQRRSDKRSSKIPSEFSEKNLDIRRVARVVKGGKRFRFRATVALGDKKGRVGIGIGKGLDVATAVEKAKKKASKNIMRVLLKDGTIPHEVYGKYSSARVIIKPASKGHGLVAGGAVRAVLGLSGVRDASAKILSRTTNRLTNAMAALEALKRLKS